MTGRRLAQGGLIDRDRPIEFVYEGRRLRGFAGDTLASALLANGVSVVGRSFKYHRPRGLLAAGVEEPNAIMQVGHGSRVEPNVRATEAELYPDLTAHPVNCWPSARRDLGAVNNLISRFIPAGFYYKTFMWPDWHLFEPLIRRAAGLGRPSAEPDPDRYETRHAHCDVLVVGSGPAGLRAALEATQSGARVMLVEQDSRVGGSLLWRRGNFEGLSGLDWLKRVAAELEKGIETTVLTRTTAAGYFDHNSLTLVERLNADVKARGAADLPRQRLWMVRAKRVILATGAIERPIVFPGNDRPGVMLASAVLQYLHRWAAVAGERAVVFTDNDSAYETAHALLDAGSSVGVLIDSRAKPPETLVAALRARQVDVEIGAVVVGTQGAPTLRRVRVCRADGSVVWIKADLLAMSGGWNPTVHLFSQSGGKLAWDETIAAFRPGISVQAEISVGAASGFLSSIDGQAWSIEPRWRVMAPGKAFVDFQNDVTTADIELAAREAFVSVEHLKRYTTLGMAPDQGKTSNVNALAIMAELTGRGIPQTGVTRFRFPYTGVSFGVLAGQARGDLFRPIRRLAAHDRHTACGAVFEEYGGWRRPAYYSQAGESAHAAQQREALAVRRAVGLFDGSPLGKIEVKGPDAAKFLDRVYANTMSSLNIGRARYGLMCNELGVIFDDGVTLRLAEDYFLVGTSGAGASKVAAWLEEWLQCEWTDYNVLIAPVTTALAVLILSGPGARRVLEAAGVDFPLGPADFPHMTFRDGKVAGLAVRVVRVSFTGELSFEINVAADRAGDLWDALKAAGDAYDLTPVGIDAWMLLRTEKGYPHIGAETDGSTTPQDVGWARVLKRKTDFIGRRALTRSHNLSADRLELVGLEAVESIAALPVGAHLRASGLNHDSEGYVTSTGFSPILGRGVALGMVRRGHARHGEILEVATFEGQGRRVRISPPGTYDAEGARLHD